MIKDDKKLCLTCMQGFNLPNAQRVQLYTALKQGKNMILLLISFSVIKSDTKMVKNISLIKC